MQMSSNGLSSVMAGYLLGPMSALEKSGVDSQAILTRCGIGSTLTNDPMNRVSSALIPEVLKQGVRITGDPFFSFKAASYMKALDLHVLGLGLLSSSSLVSFCQRLARFMPLISESGSVVLDATPTSYRLVTRPRGPICPNSEDIWLAFVINLIRQVHSKEFTPVSVRTIHSILVERKSFYNDFFGAPASGGHSEIVIEISKEDALLPLRSGNEALASVQDISALSYLGLLHSEDIVARAQRAIIESLEEYDAVSMESVATSLGKRSAHQLRAELAHRDTNYQAVLDQTRAYLAKLKLRSTTTSITEIAHSLGFSDSANFTRAFRRWTGQSPRQFRLRGNPARSRLN